MSPFPWLLIIATVTALLQACFVVADEKVEANQAGGCTQGTLRLVAGLSRNEGRVEFCNNRQWGTVCDDYFGPADARVVCRQLGLPTSGARPVRRAAGRRGPIWLDNVNCTGDESRLINCPANPIGTTDCGHREDVGVICPACRQGALRLVGGRSKHEGRVELCHRGRWGTVCDNSWDSTDARVVCQQLELPTNVIVAVPKAGFGAGSGTIWLDNVRCRGSDTRLLNCPANPIGTHANSCGHDDDAGVKCLACREGDLRLLGGKSQNEGRVELCHQEIWGTVCDNLWDSADARVVCQQLGLPTNVTETVVRPGFGPGSGPKWLDNVSCRGDETSLLDCGASKFGTVNCSYGAGVRCLDQSQVTNPTETTTLQPPVKKGCKHGAVRLVGKYGRIGGQRAGRVDFCNKGKWGTVCGDSKRDGRWNKENTVVVCKQLKIKKKGTYGDSIPEGSRYFGRASGPIWLSNVRCKGTEASLLNCPANPIGKNNCDHTTDVAVRCGLVPGIPLG